MVEIGVVDDGVPYCAAAANLPPFATFPGLSSKLHFWMFKGLGRIAWNREKAPDLFAGLGIIRCDIASYAELGAAVTDKDFALGSTRCAGDAVVPLGIDDGVDFPDLLAAASIDGYQATIQCADVNLALIDRNTSIDWATTEAS